MGKRLRSDLTAFAVLASLLGAANLLSPDTSLQLVRQAGVLRVCVPASFAPLVTGNAQNPGFDVSVLEEIARRMKVRFSMNVNTSMGRDFNPANWRITRAQCEIIAGGVVTSRQTRSFLETIETGVENGWMLISQSGAGLVAGRPVGVYPGFSGLDRLKLSAYLREKGLQIVLVSTPEALSQGLKAGQYDVAVAGNLDSLLALDAAPGLTATWLPENLERFAFGFGLWKGDVTLKREVRTIYRDLEREGFVSKQKTRYGLKSIDPKAF